MSCDLYLLYGYFETQPHALFKICSNKLTYMSCDLYLLYGYFETQPYVLFKICSNKLT